MYIYEFDKYYKLTLDKLTWADFYNWNRVKLRYCDGGSFAGDAKFDNGVRKYDITVAFYPFLMPWSH